MPPPLCGPEAVAIHELSLPVLSFGRFNCEGWILVLQTGWQFANRKSCISRMGIEGFLELCLSAILGGRYLYLLRV